MSLTDIDRDKLPAPKAKELPGRPRSNRPPEERNAIHFLSIAGPFLGRRATVRMDRHLLLDDARRAETPHLPRVEFRQSMSYESRLRPQKLRCGPAWPYGPSFGSQPWFGEDKDFARPRRDLCRGQRADCR